MLPRTLVVVSCLLAAAPSPAADTGNRPGKEVVDSVCSTCHRAGLKGAPKIGDRDAWIPRMKRGIHELALSAIRGHGGMPARGGHAELTDTEVRNAILHMFDPGAAARAATASPPATAPKSGPNLAIVDGIEVHFGLMSAERLRAFPRGSPEASMHGGVPAGDGNYHVNVTLFDARSHAAITNAAVEVEIVQPGAAARRKALEPMKQHNAASYGQYLKLAPRTPSTITVRVRKPGADRDTEARFKPLPE